MTPDQRKENRRTDTESEEPGRAKQKPPLKVFLSGSIRGGRDLLPTYRLIYELLQEAGAEVVSWHVVDPDLEARESDLTEEEIYARDMGLLSESDALVAEVTVPSIGVGYEICRALVKGLPVLCLHRPEAAVSSMLLGNPGPDLKVLEYSGSDELKKYIEEFIENIEVGKKQNPL